MYKKILFWIVCLAVWVFAGALAAPAVYANCTFHQGSGTLTAPYEIKDYEELYCLSLNQYYYASTHFKLIADIEFPPSFWASNTWIPIGSEDRPFSGSFNGNGHKIKGLKVINNNPNSSNIGMFGKVVNGGNSGEIQDLVLEDVDVDSAGDHVGAVVGWLDTGILEGVYVTGKVKGRDQVGGLAGLIEGFSGIKNSYATDIWVEGRTDVGGLVGRNVQGSYIDSAYFVGDVKGESAVGGVLGSNYGSDGYNPYVRYVYAAGSVSGNTHVGGLVGEQDDAFAYVESSYWSNEASTSVGNGKGSIIRVGKLNEEEMKFEDSFGEFDWLDWNIIEGVSYPYLEHSYGQITVSKPTSPYSYPSSGQAVTIEGTTNSTLTLRYLIVDSNNGKVQEGALGAIDSPSFTETADFGALLPGKYSLWLWGTYGARGIEAKKVELHVPPSAPANLKAEGTWQITLQWDAVPGADSYTVYKFPGLFEPDEDEWQKIETGFTGTSYPVTGLVYGDTYWFTVSAVAKGMEGEQAQPVTVVPLLPVAGVEIFQDLRMKPGTPLNQVGLPNPVQVTLADNTPLTVAVTWDGGHPPYDENRPGTYTFTGTLLLTDPSIINPDNLTATIRVIVARPSPTYYPVTGVSLNKERLQLVEYGEPYRLEAQVEPFYATLPLVTWESSDPEVAMVDTNGVVTPLKAGTAVITVTTTDGGYTAECVVTVVKEEGIEAPNGFYIGGDIKRYYSISVLLRSDRVLKQAIREMDEVGLDQVFFVIDNVGATLREISKSGLRDSLRPLKQKDFHEDGYDVIDEQGEGSDKIRPGYEE